MGGSEVECLSLAQGVTLESQDRVCLRLSAWSLLLPLPVSLPLFLCVSLMNKKNKIFKKGKKRSGALGEGEAEAILQRM